MYINYNISRMNESLGEQRWKGVQSTDFCEVWKLESRINLAQLTITFRSRGVVFCKKTGELTSLFVHYTSVVLLAVVNHAANWRSIHCKSSKRCYEQMRLVQYLLWFELKMHINFKMSFENLQYTSSEKALLKQTFFFRIPKGLVDRSALL